ncbi:MAG TPA: ComEC/Rec2 family competence protein [Pyrinomonadaceae bacterium]|nr:ComEC/Rec2 family competence protein [Pyrinomonadaceae bacterium]
MSDLPHARFTTQPLLVIVFSLATGVLFFYYCHNPKLTTALVVAGITFLALATRFYRRVVLVATTSILLSSVCAGYLLASVEARAVSPDRIVRLFEQGTIQSAEPVELTGELSGEPKTSPDGFYLNVKAERLRLRGREQSASRALMLLAHAGDPSARAAYDRLQLHHGARIRVMTLLDRDDDYRNPGVMPFTEYLERKGYDATGVIKSPLLVERLEDARVLLPLAWLYQWRAQLERQFDAHFSMETAGVLDAVLLGNRYKVSGEVAERFREGGAFHVLVIAGLHISFIAGLLFLLLRRITRNRAIQFGCVVSLVFAYSLMVGAEAPVIRAAMVFSLGICAPLVWRRASSLNLIAGAALVLLVWRPSDLCDPSFQLTFLSVIAIVTLATPIMLRLQQVGNWRPTHATPFPPSAPRWFRSLAEGLFWSERAWKAELAESNIRYRLFKTSWAVRLERSHLQRPLCYAAGAIIVSASVQIGLLPLLIIYFHRVSVASLLMNIFIGMAMIVFATTALIAIVVAQVSPAAAAPLITAAEKIERLMVHAIDPVTRWAVASFRLPHYHGVAAGVYLLYFVALAFLIAALSKWNPLRPITSSNGAPSAKTKVMATIFVLLLCVIIFHPFSAPRPDGKLRIDFLDVGQGDSALITMPDGATLLIDGGGRPNIDWNREGADTEPSFERDTRSIGERVVSEFLWARGLDRVDYVLPTHADADHIDGLNDVANNFRVRAAMVARTPKDDPEYARFARTMKLTRVPIEQIGAGDVLRFGDVSVDVVWPAPTIDETAPWRNNDGAVLRVRYGNQTFLFTADIEREAEANILRAQPELRSDIVKVAHHGSRTSSTQQFVDATKAAFAVISVGRTSIFGHPHREVVDRWRVSGAEVLTTGERGMISVRTDGRSCEIERFIQ